MSHPGRDRPPRAGLRRPPSFALWLLALVAAVWIPRALAVLDRGAAGTARGFAADFVCALALAAALVWFGRRRWLRLGVGGLWLLLHWAAYEHVRALDAPLALHHAGYLLDPVFVAGSVASLSRPWILLGLVVAVVAWLWPSMSQDSTTRRRGAVQATILAVLLALGMTLWHAPANGWRARSTAGAALASLTRALTPDVAPEDVLGDFLDLPRDLAGTPWLPTATAGETPSVVLLVLEGVSASYLPSVRADAGALDPGIDLPALDDLARRLPTATQLVNQQRQTHRGLWSLLCGRPPRATSTSALFSEVALSGRAPDPPCLPAVLAARGYRTVFSQSSPLSFMHKDLALPLFGFDIVEKLTVEKMESSDALAESAWGVDDLTFLRLVRERIGELRRGGSPYFLTVLTSGTHHPYAVPGEAISGAGDPSLADAMAYLDRAVGELMAGLTADGVLDDTLLILTADESAGAVGGLGGSGDSTAMELVQNHGLAILSLPRDRRRAGDPAPRLRTPYLQSDLALSVVDFLASEDQDPAAFGGRSLFRHYDDDRPLPFANTYYHWVGEYLPGEAVVLCGQAGDDCRRLDVAGGPFRLTGTTASTETPELVRRWLGLDALPANAAEPVPLTLQRELVLHEGGPGAIVFGGQYLELAAGTSLEVRLAAEVADVGDGGDEGRGWLHLRHDLTSQTLLRRPMALPALAPGDRFELRYRLAPTETLRGLSLNLAADVLTGGPLVLRIERAEMRILPAGDAATPPEAADEGGLEILHHQVVRHREPEPIHYVLGPEKAEAAGCVRQLDGAWQASACAPGEVLSGPKRYVAPGSELTLRWHLRGRSGTVSLRGLVGSRDPSLVYGQTEELILAAGEKRLLELETTVEPTLESSLAALFLAAGEEDATFDIDQVEMIVLPP